jgi:molybdenum cofactor cytidylyltransferase
MKFAYRPAASCEGMLLGHSIGLASGRLRKGAWLTADDVTALLDAGVTTVFAGEREPHDVMEDDAAQQIAEHVCGAALTPEAPHTGRCNLLANADGLLHYTPETLINLNLVDQRITCAMLANLSPVARGDLVGTVKIIPFAVPQDVLSACKATWQPNSAITIAPYRGGSAHLLETRLPSVKPLSDKVKEITRQRAQRVSLALSDIAAAPHQPETVAQWLRKSSQQCAPEDVLLVFGASATVDEADVIPAAIQQAGGILKRVGMAADPGNLLVHGTVNGIDVIGLPGCAKSPALNGFDWVLERIAANVPITAHDWATFSVGGLLKEIKTRPQPRRLDTPAP